MSLEGVEVGFLEGHLRSTSAEVAKTRLQLQGELMRSASGEKVYKNEFDVFVKTWRNEGLRGVQRGLGPAVRLIHLTPTIHPSFHTISAVRLPGCAERIAIGPVRAAPEMGE